MNGLSPLFAFSSPVACFSPRRAGWPAGCLLPGARRPPSNLDQALPRQTIGGDGAVEGGACEGARFHVGDHADTAVGRLGVANALTTPGAEAHENLLLQAYLDAWRDGGFPVSLPRNEAARTFLTIGVDVSPPRLAFEAPDWEALRLERKQQLAAGLRAGLETQINALLGVPYAQLGKGGAPFEHSSHGLLTFNRATGTIGRKDGSK